MNPVLSLPLADGL